MGCDLDFVFKNLDLLTLGEVCAKKIIYRDGTMLQVNRSDRNGRSFACKDFQRVARADKS